MWWRNVWVFFVCAVQRTTTMNEMMMDCARARDARTRRTHDARRDGVRRVVRWVRCAHADATAAVAVRRWRGVRRGRDGRGRGRVRATGAERWGVRRALVVGGVRAARAGWGVRAGRGGWGVRATDAASGVRGGESWWRCVAIAHITSRCAVMILG